MSVGRAAGGIVLLRDTAAPTEASEAHILRNRCHDHKKGSGILLRSACGTVENNNECWDSRHGIVLQRDIKALTEASDAHVLHNRCHGHEEAGIVLFSASGRVEYNECWANRQGIVLHRDQAAPTEATDASIFGNRCYKNETTGIMLSSARGKVEGNECWANEIGIMLQRDIKALTEASEAQIVYNRCHDHEEAGILLFSAHGRFEGNECWANSRGIVLRRDPEAPTKATDTHITGNRCHDHERAGIVLSSARGTVESNVCWANETGIVLIGHSETPMKATDAYITANRLQENRFGAKSISSTGIFADNLYAANSQVNGHEASERDTYPDVVPTVINCQIVEPILLQRHGDAPLIVLLADKQDNMLAESVGVHHIAG